MTLLLAGFILYFSEHCTADWPSGAVHYALWINCPEWITSLHHFFTSSSSLTWTVISYWWSFAGSAINDLSPHMMVFSIFVFFIIYSLFSDWCLLVWGRSQPFFTQDPPIANPNHPIRSHNIKACIRSWCRSGNTKQTSVLSCCSRCGSALKLPHLCLCITAVTHFPMFIW